MEEKHRKNIQSNFVSLVEQTDLDRAVSLLYEKGVFSEAMIEPYKDETKSQKERKRMLFRDIERRGPKAYEKLLETLTEIGHWDLVRSLEPENTMFRQYPRESFLSLRNKTNKPSELNHSTKTHETINIPSTSTSETQLPADIEVVKSTDFVKDDMDSDIRCYRTRKKQRGVCLIITNIKFQDNIEEYRRGAETDHRNLKELFYQIGFKKVLSYENLSLKDMEETISNFADLEGLDEAECLFVIISSHGYESLYSSDTDIRCKDGKLVSTSFIIRQFNNENCPRMYGKPKVFIFQTCRGQNSTHDFRSKMLPTNHTVATDGSSYNYISHRMYSDILIAHSTIPGFAAHRHPEHGSWYIQALCKVFAERSHDCDVEKLFTLVDMELEKTFKFQTSSIEKWGFNNKLYLHPGLFEEA